MRAVRSLEGRVIPISSYASHFNEKDRTLYCQIRIRAMKTWLTGVGVTPNVMCIF
jgi:hypothetical protein